jgi:hypothetical protein
VSSGFFWLIGCDRKPAAYILLRLSGALRRDRWAAKDILALISKACLCSGKGMGHPVLAEKCRRWLLVMERRLNLESNIVG